MTENFLDGEALPGKTQTPKTQKQRVSDALILSAKGHLVSPLGKPKRKGAKLVPSRAHPVGENGPVTVPQLWAVYMDLFTKSFGLELLPEIMANTKENVSRYFDDMRQTFLEVTGFLPENRDLYEYLVWFHKPERLRGLLQANRQAGSAGYVHPIKRFYDEAVVKSQNERYKFTSERVAKQRKLTTFVMSAYDKIRTSGDDNLVYSLVNYGYVLVAEYLHDYKGWNASTCRQSIIEAMVALLKAATDKKKAIDFLNYAWKATETNEPCFTSEVWPDWREACKDMLDVAIKLSENQ
jgi:hypothetical protein